MKNLKALLQSKTVYTIFGVPYEEIRKIKVVEHKDGYKPVQDLKQNPTDFKAFKEMCFDDIDSARKAMRKSADKYVEELNKRIEYVYDVTQTFSSVLKFPDESEIERQPGLTNTEHLMQVLAKAFDELRRPSTMAQGVYESVRSMSAISDHFDEHLKSAKQEIVRNPIVSEDLDAEAVARFPASRTNDHMLRTWWQSQSESVQPLIALATPKFAHGSPFEDILAEAYAMERRQVFVHLVTVLNTRAQRHFSFTMKFDRYEIARAKMAGENPKLVITPFRNKKRFNKSNLIRVSRFKL